MSDLNMDPMVSNFLDLVKNTREKKKLTREQLAKLANIHKTTVGLLERKQRVPSLQIANQLAKALELKLSWMLKKVEG